MSVLQTSRPAPFGAITAYHVINGLERLVHGVRAHFAAIETRRQLEQLTDTQLNDIGVTRYDIEAIVARTGRWA